MKTFIPLGRLNLALMITLMRLTGCDRKQPGGYDKSSREIRLVPVLAFHDIYSLDDPALFSLIPRPVYALLVTIPLTETWRRIRQTENDSMEEYLKSGTEEPVIWFKQTIGHACGLIGLLHSVCNGKAADMIMQESELARIIKDAVPLKTAARAKLLEDSDVLERAHAAAAVAGDTDAPRLHVNEHLGNHFIAFVGGSDGHLWELEGSRKGPLDRGILGEKDDMLSERALEMGIKRYLRLEHEAGGQELRFSCIALAPKMH